MACEWRVKLDSYVDGELPPRESAQYDEHLRECPACTATVLHCLQMKQAIRSSAAARYAPPPALHSRIFPAASGPSRQPRRRWLPQFSLVAAAAMVLVAATAFWLARQRPADVTGELLDLHVSALASLNPVDVLSSDRHTVKPWFEGRLPFTFSLPDLQGTPFRLIGGRVSYFEQSPGAQLLFGIRKHQMSVFIFQDRVVWQRLRSVAAETQRSGFAIAAWRQGELCYVVVGDTGVDDVSALRHLLHDAANH